MNFKLPGEFQTRMLTPKDNKHDGCSLVRSFTDEEVLQIRAEWAASGLSVRQYVSNIKEPKAGLHAYRAMIYGYSYRYLPMPE